MIDSGTDVSCIQEGLVPTKYFEKTTHMVKSTSGHALDIKYKLSNTRTPFINAIYPFTNINAKGFSATYKRQDISYTFITEPISRDINALIEMKQKHVDYLQLEIFSMNIFDTLKSAKVQEKIKLISEKMAIDICADHPSVFWNQKKHIVTLPYEDDFFEENIPTKSRPCQMNTELFELYKKEIDNLLQKDLIKPSKSPWSCTAFYVNNAAEKERGVPRLYDANIFSKSGYWQIQIFRDHSYGTTFNVPFGQYEWNICQGKMTPIQRSIEFASKFPDIITDKMQLQQFLGSLNYISPFYKNLSRDLALLFDSLKKDQKKPWTNSLRDLVKIIKERVKS
ncbi:hypothetical protein H5410_050632 [Solanum commersonii]|uniref:Peptidase A2 domain-containing protein n=1 Tax=Solanum commersonii TaxID=4109 RepID=A0A9J5WXL6_SOLCO|nr:hypothetical protein H5410_050632 [Solanum commersonii]